MPSTQVSGLVSGLDTSQIISQLMQIERVPQQRLVQKRDGIQKLLDAYRTLNTKFSSIESAAEALTTFKGFSPTSATSSDETRVTATSSEGAAEQSLTFTVENLAVAEQAATSGTVASTDTQVTSLAQIRLTVGGTSETLDVGGGTLSEVVAAINNSSFDVKASAVKVADGQYKLHIASTKTGDAYDISVDDGAGGAAFSASTLGEVAEVIDGEDAVLRVGGAGGYAVTRSSNTISDLMDGVTLTLLQEDAVETVTVSVGGDAEALADKVQAMVDAVNETLKYIRDNSKFNAASGSGGIFLGDSTARQLQSRLVNAVTNAVDGSTLGAPSSAGITLGRDGSIKFDREKFIEEYNDDPEAVEAVIGKGTDPDFGVAGRLDALAFDAVRTGEGIIEVAIDGRETEIDRLNDRIADWDVRLASRERNLQRQFTALETVLSQMQAQASWLSGALSGIQFSGS
ncbi:MAG TPA: flagellar filament capping protein FliD [Acidimicrobiia bacterium]|nr:flagellar filament capping protein FliD [Acidimicrobiia bacterium]